MTAKDSMAGHVVKCAGCGKPVAVAGPDPEPTIAPPPVAAGPATARGRPTDGGAGYEALMLAKMNYLCGVTTVFLLIEILVRLGIFPR